MSLKPAYRLEYAKVKNQASAKSGVHHWWYQRFTSIGLIFLLCWLVIFLYQNKSNTAENLILNLIKLPNLIPAILLDLFGFYHGFLGMQVIIEDYIHDLRVRFALMIALKLFCIVTAMALLISLFHLLLIRV